MSKNTLRIRECLENILDDIKIRYSKTNLTRLLTMIRFQTRTGKRVENKEISKQDFKLYFETLNDLHNVDGQGSVDPIFVTEFLEFTPDIFDSDFSTKYLDDLCELIANELHGHLFERDDEYYKREMKLITHFSYFDISVETLANELISFALFKDVNSAVSIFETFLENKELKMIRIGVIDSDTRVPEMDLSYIGIGDVRIIPLCKLFHVLPADIMKCFTDFNTTGKLYRSSCLVYKYTVKPIFQEVKDSKLIKKWSSVSRKYWENAKNGILSEVQEFGESFLFSTDHSEIESHIKVVNQEQHEDFLSPPGLGLYNIENPLGTHGMFQKDVYLRIPDKNSDYLLRLVFNTKGFQSALSLVLDVPLVFTHEYSVVDENQILYFHTRRRSDNIISADMMPETEIYHLREKPNIHIEKDDLPSNVNEQIKMWHDLLIGIRSLDNQFQNRVATSIDFWQNGKIVKTLHQKVYNLHNALEILIGEDSIDRGKITANIFADSLAFLLLEDVYITNRNQSSFLKYKECFFKFYQLRSKVFHNQYLPNELGPFFEDIEYYLTVENSEVSKAYKEIRNLVDPLLDEVNTLYKKCLEKIMLEKEFAQIVDYNDKPNSKSFIDTQDECIIMDQIVNRQKSMEKSVGKTVRSLNENIKKLY